MRTNVFFKQTDSIFHFGLIFTFCMPQSTPLPLIPLISVDDFNTLKIIFHKSLLLCIGVLSLLFSIQKSKAEKKKFTIG